MKKKPIVTMFIFIIMLISCIIPFSVRFANNSSNSYSEKSITAVSNLISEYDKDKSYVTCSEYCGNTISDEVMQEYNEKYKFQTCRLILKSNDKIESNDSIDYEKLNKNTYIIQYKNEKDTKSAYDYYSNLDDIEYVEPDIIVETFENDYNNINPYETINPSIAKVTKAGETKEYLLNNVKDFKDIKVAIVDSGVNKEISSIKGRFIGGKTLCDSLNKNDGGYDDRGHGTAVAGVLISNTLPNTKILSYKIINKEGTCSTALVALGIEQAVIDGADVINLSLGSEGCGPETIQIINDSVNFAYNNHVIVIASAGNSNVNLNNRGIYPASCENAIAVGSCGTAANKLDYSNYGNKVKIYAPGVVQTYTNEGVVKQHIGTSFSAPCVAGECANILTLYNECSFEEVYQRLLDGSTTKMKTQDNGYGINMLNSLLINTPKQYKSELPKYKLIDNNDGTRTVELSTNEENSNIYYAKILKFDNEISKYSITDIGYYLYTEPILIDDAYDFLFFAQSGTKLNSELKDYRIIPFQSFNGFYCNNDGKIVFYNPNEYNGDYKNLVIPSVIDGITVTGFDIYCMSAGSHLQGFFNHDVESIVLPSNIKELPTDLCAGCTELKSFIADGVTKIGDGTFYACRALENIKISELDSIGEFSFSICKSLKHFPYLEKVTCIPREAFRSSGLKCVYAPNCTTIGNSAFAYSYAEDIYLPNATTIGSGAFASTLNLKTINIDSVNSELSGDELFCDSGIKNIDIYGDDIKDWFEGCELERIYLPNIKAETINHEFNPSRVEFDSLNWLYISSRQNSICVIPSTISSVSIRGFNGTFYGSKDSFIEKYAEENGEEFIEITEDTAMISPLPDTIESIDSVLFADVIGFNKKYQWYANDTSDNTTGIAINGATNQSFNPLDYPKANYYYCVVISQDVGYEPIIITTNVTKNNICYHKYSIKNSDNKEVTFICYNCKDKETYSYNELLCEWNYKILNTIPDYDTYKYDLNSDYVINAKDYVIINNNR